MGPSGWGQQGRGERNGQHGDDLRKYSGSLLPGKEREMRKNQSSPWLGDGRHSTLALANKMLILGFCFVLFLS